MIASRLSTLMLLTMGLSGCGGDVTEIFVCYSIDEALQAGDTLVRVCVRDGSGEIIAGCSDAQLSVGMTGMTASQAFVQGSADDLHIVLEADIQRPGPSGTFRTVTFSQEIAVPFSPGEIIDVSLRLEEACAERSCVDGTCVDGACVPVEVSSRCLTPHGAAPAAGCTDVRLTSVCAAPNDDPEAR